MTSSVTPALIYRLTAVFALLGTVVYLPFGGLRQSAAFLLGACCSLGNLWVFDWLSRSIAPGGSSRKPWQAGAFVTRYLVLLSIGYAIVKALDVSPLAVVLGLLASAAAVLTSIAIEIIFQSSRGRARIE